MTVTRTWVPNRIGIGAPFLEPFGAGMLWEESALFDPPPRWME
jgi:hypothetical protein